MKSFLVGSRIYDYPDSKSDLDLVIFCTKEKKTILIDKSDNYCILIHYHNLNIICCTNEDPYTAWKLGTEKCIARGPVTRIEAKAIFDEVRKELGLKYQDDSGE